jgi:histone acetyltransferase (RNA polymerase elongator complex component)
VGLFSFGKKDKLDKTTKVAVASQVVTGRLNRAITQGEAEELLKQDHLITDTSGITYPLLVLANIEQNSGHTNFSALAAAIANDRIHRCTRLTPTDANIIRIQHRILFRNIAAHQTAEDIENGVFDFIDVVHMSADEGTLDSLGGWKTNKIKKDVESHEVIMTEGKKQQNKFGMGQ